MVKNLCQLVQEKAEFQSTSERSEERRFIVNNNAETLYPVLISNNTNIKNSTG